MSAELARVIAGIDDSEARVENSVLDADRLLHRLENTKFDAEKLVLIVGFEGKLTDTQARALFGQALSIGNAYMRRQVILQVAPKIPERLWLEPWLVAARDGDENVSKTALEMIELSFRVPGRLAVYERWRQLIDRASHGRRPELLSTMKDMVPAMTQLAGSEQNFIEDIADAGAWWP